MTDQCPHKTLKKQLTGRQFWYRCEACPQKFNAEPWDGRVELVEPAAPVAVTGERAAEPGKPEESISVLIDRTDEWEARKDAEPDKEKP